MTGLAGFVMRGPVQAGLVGATGVMLALMFPPASWVSGAAVALYALRKGAGAGLLAAAIALVGTVAFTWLALANPLAGLGMALSVWVPVLLVALTLRATVRLDWSLLVAAALGFAAVLALFAVLGDPGEFWYRNLSAALSLERMQSEFGWSTGEVDAQAWQGLLAEVARWMSGTLGAVVLVNTALSVLLARYWQSALYNPGGFADEFHALRLGRGAAAAALAVVTGAWFSGAELLTSLAVVVLTLYLFQGLAVAHGVVKRRGMGRGWLVGLYLLMVFALPQVALVLAALGISDAWLDIRNRVRPASS